MAWQATDRLFLSASLAFLDGEYGEFDAAGCTAVQAAALLQLNNDAPGGELTSVSSYQAQWDVSRSSWVTVLHLDLLRIFLADHWDLTTLVL